ncbi:MAG: hypothetical protein JXA11_03745 [Phycisphaerae bacterium]|nr:hypothetical protein [Phycisphaerae bacterium]
MYITAGTTSSRVHVVGRWAYVGSVLVGAGMGFAGYRPWACLTVFWLLAWLVWMVSALIRRQRHIPGNLVHVFLLGVGLLLAVHLVSNMVDRGQTTVTTMEGQLDASMLFHMALLSLGVFLAQSFLGDGDHIRLTRFCGGAIVVGSAASIIAPLSSGARDAHVITLLAGLFIFTAPRWTRRPRRLFWSSTARASFLLSAVVSLLVMFILTILWWNISGTPVWRTPKGWFGLGESAFTAVSGASSGSAVLGATTGVVGWCLFVVGSLAALGRAMVRGRWERTEFFWIAATALSTLAMLSPGGYFPPLTAVTFALTWGLLPRICGLRTMRMSGLFLVGVMLVIALLLGVTRRTGLFITLSQVFGLNDKQTHGVFGFLLAVTAAWWLGANRWWLGAIGLAAAALLGGLGELAQRVVATGRTPELADWGAHAIGAAAAAVPVGLCFIARRAEPAKPGMLPPRRSKSLSRGVGWALLFVVLAASVGWLGMSGWQLVETWRWERPWFVVSDGINIPGKSSYSLTGLIEPTPPEGMSLLMTVSAADVRAVTLWRGRLYAGLLSQGVGLHRQSILGQPFGELSTHPLQEGRFLILEKGSPVFAVDVGMVFHRRDKDTEGLDKVLAALKQEGTVVFFETSQPREYWKIRPLIQLQYPDTPCVVRIPATGNSTDVLAQLCAQTGSKLVVLTTDANLARAAGSRLGGGVDVHLIDSESPAGSRRKGLTVHAGPREYLQSRLSTKPAKS